MWLVDGKLLVAHDRENAQPGKTLESLYLDPLDEVVRQEGHSVYPGWDGSLQVLIDTRSDGESTYAAIEQERSVSGRHRTSRARHADHINTDDLTALEQFLKAQPR